MINYIKGDATQPEGSGKKIIVHICNNINAWGAGFVLAISRRWDAPQQAFHARKGQLRLGDVQFVPVENDIVVANMIAQEGIRYDYVAHRPPIRYGAVRVCLSKVQDFANACGATVHMPRIGAGLAGGDWNEIEKIIEETLFVDVYVYELK